MKSKLSAIIGFWMIISSSHAVPLNLAALPWANDYKVDSYIQAAIELQLMGREAACKTLLEFDQTYTHNYYYADSNMRLIVLCRMLFIQHGTNTFRPAFTGGHGGLVSTSDKDWPSFPITIVNGVPFCIHVGGSRMDGGSSPERGDHYLFYCMTNCDWNTFQFHEVTAQQKNEALTNLLSSSNWKRPLNNSERDFLSKQIE
jgi:hypothetical protein